jgi:eukaryotic-like serine/threonine-protein kinase
VTAAGGPRTLAGRYRLEEVIGRGGMSTVYRGIDLALDRVVAVKVALDPLVEQSPIYLARFTREAQAAAAIGHPEVVTVYDAGADGPTRFIVMELVQGRSLAEILREREHKPLEPHQAARIAAQVADALSAAHAAGIIHRDIKPGNIMVTPDGSVKVLDFGIARALDSHTLTQTATVLGTSAYMSPEQALGQPADARSDIYSLGCVLYEMLTGEPPFTAEVSAAVLHQHVRIEPKPARERDPAIPPALGDLVMQMLAKSPKDRPQTAAEVRDRLRQAPSDLQDDGDELTTIAMAAAMAPTPANVPLEATEPTPEATEPTPEATEPTPGAAEPTGATEPLADETEPTEATALLTPRQPDRAPPARARTTASPPPSSPPRRTTGFWITVFVVAVVLLGGAVAVALTGGGSAGTSSSTTGRSSPALTSSHTTTGQPQTHPTTTSTTTPSRTTNSSSTSTTKSTTPTVGTTSRTTASAPTTSTTAPTTSTGALTTGTTTP